MQYWIFFSLTYNMSFLPPYKHLCLSGINYFERIAYMRTRVAEHVSCTIRALHSRVAELVSCTIRALHTRVAKTWALQSVLSIPELLSSWAVQSLLSIPELQRRELYDSCSLYQSCRVVSSTIRVLHTRVAETWAANHSVTTDIIIIIIIIIILLKQDYKIQLVNNKIQMAWLTSWLVVDTMIQWYILLKQDYNTIGTIIKMEMAWLILTSNLVELDKEA